MLFTLALAAIAQPAPAADPPWEGPLVHVAPGVLEAADGARIPLSRAAELAGSRPGVPEAWERHRAAVGAQHTGGLLVGLGVLLATFWAPMLASEARQPAFVATRAAYGGVVIGTAAAGAACLTVGSIRQPPATRALVERINGAGP